jgi:hypothetical protein
MGLLQPPNPLQRSSQGQGWVTSGASWDPCVQPTRMPPVTLSQTLLVAIFSLHRSSWDKVGRQAGPRRTLMFNQRGCLLSHFPKTLLVPAKYEIDLLRKASQIPCKPIYLQLNTNPKLKLQWKSWMDPPLV